MHSSLDDFPFLKKLPTIEALKTHLEDLQASRLSIRAALREKKDSAKSTLKALRAAKKKLPKLTRGNAASRLEELRLAVSQGELGPSEDTAALEVIASLESSLDLWPQVDALHEELAELQQQIDITASGLARNAKEIQQAKTSINSHVSLMKKAADEIATRPIVRRRKADRRDSNNSRERRSRSRSSSPPSSSPITTPTSPLSTDSRSSRTSRGSRQGSKRLGWEQKGLFEAVDSGNVAKVESDLLSVMADGSFVHDVTLSRRGHSLLTLAVSCGRHEIVKLLLNSARPGIAVTNANGDSALWIALNQPGGASSDMTKLLLGTPAANRNPPGPRWFPSVIGKLYHTAPAVVRALIPVLSAIAGSTTGLAFPVDLAALDPRSGWSLLMSAVSNGDAELVSLLLDHGPKICQSCPGVNVIGSGGRAGGQSALHLAANLSSSSTSATLTKMLLKAGANPALIDINGWTALHKAIAAGSKDTAMALVESIQRLGPTRTPLSELSSHGAPLHWLLAGSHGSRTTVLHAAVGRGWTDLVTALLQRGVDIEAQDRSRETPLSIAVRKEDVAMVRYLLKAGAKTAVANKAGNTPLHTAVRAADPAEILVCLLDAPDGHLLLDRFNDEGWTALMAATAVNSVSAMTVLLEAGANIDLTEDYDGVSVLQLARTPEAMEAILNSQQVDVTAELAGGVRILALAASRWNTAIIRKVCELARRTGTAAEAAAPQRGSGSTALHDLVRRRPTPGQTPQDEGVTALKTLLEFYPDLINVPDSTGWTPLHTAIVRGSHWLVEALIEAGANVAAATTPSRETPLHFAMKRGHRQMAKAVLGGCKDPELLTTLRTNEGWSVQDMAPVHLAEFLPPLKTPEVAPQPTRSFDWKEAFPESEGDDSDTGAGVGAPSRRKKAPSSSFANKKSTRRSWADIVDDDDEE